MNGAECLIRTLVAGDVTVCFTNPGTSEMHVVAALDRVNGMRAILGLFEGVVTGAADGYFRMADKPAATLLHLGPGLSNGLANLHNAKKASSALVNIVGEHATWHLKYNAPLASDIEGIARPVSHWVRTSANALSIGEDCAGAISAASGPPGRIATLILPGDTAWGASEVVGKVQPRQGGKPPDPTAIVHAARVLSSGEPTLLVMAGRALRSDALTLAGRIAAKTDCTIGTQFFSARIERGAGRVPTFRIPYAPDRALQKLKSFRHIITVETSEPVAFFAYPGKPSRLKPQDCQVHELCAIGENSLAALDALAAELGAHQFAPRLQQRTAAARPTGSLTPQSIAHALAVLLPENAIVVDESLTTGRESFAISAGAPPHDWLQNMGGSIGFGTPVATGAAVACPDRKVICLSGDGCAMYTLQSLWTQAREELDVTTIVFANRAYQILMAEFAGVGAGTPGVQARDMMTIDRPTLDWLALSKGMGVPAGRVTTADEFCEALVVAAAEPGPALIEVVL